VSVCLRCVSLSHSSSISTHRISDLVCVSPIEIQLKESSGKRTYTPPSLCVIRIMMSRLHVQDVWARCCTDVLDALAVALDSHFLNKLKLSENTATQTNAADTVVK
jgi:hypothetical protein